MYVVAFTVPTIGDGQRAIEELVEFTSVDDAVMVFKDPNGRVKVRQTSDLTAGKGFVQGALLGALAGLVVGALAPVAIGAAATGIAWGALRDKGMNDDLLELAGRQLERGEAAVFVLTTKAGSAHLTRVLDELAASRQIDHDFAVGGFPAAAQDHVRAVLKAGQA